jgi:rare lipoprotein A
MKSLLLVLTVITGMGFSNAVRGGTANVGFASWYGEEHRGRLMANGKRFNPDQLTAASWHYPLGSKVRVTRQSRNKQLRTVIVRITDRGPSMDLVRDGRIIDLTHAAFARLGQPRVGLVPVKVEPLPQEGH